MKTINLAGSWQLSQGSNPPITGNLPGCTYLDYMANGMADPFWGMNEIESTPLAHHQYTYAKSFTLPAEWLEISYLDLVADGLDTLCTLRVNGAELGKTNNINRTWRLNAKPLLVAGENLIEIIIENPYPFMDGSQANERMQGAFGNRKGAAHIRKTPCHFGWDWGPELPPAGLTRAIRLEAYETRIEDLRIIQHHSQGQVALAITAQVTQALSVQGKITIQSPDGDISTYSVEGDSLHHRIKVDNPQLWWCNGLGNQPLYTVTMEISLDGVVADSQTRQIGLRTIELDTTPDEQGAQFRFVLNGVPIFAKGANWIPADSFITRVTPADMDFYIQAACRANMNMLRVWGGGMYEGEDFYDACDKYGILVWQDFIFACGSYPLHDEEFLTNVHGEVIDNVQRIRHRASLALWCSNNENEIFVKLWRKDNKAKQSNPHFYHDILPSWVSALDGITPYWPGSPSSGALEHKVHSRKTGEIRGDTHLWQIWHGMMPIEAFRKLPTRFCSEYGVESMPSMHTVKQFTDNPSPQLFDPVMLLHQKSGGGNEKILFYLLAKYRNPSQFEDFVYLSQLVQAGAIRFATDYWRRNIGFSNGSIFWQFNDCWPVASWAGIDYHKQQKAVTYHSRHFNKMCCLSNDYFNDRAELYVTNEYPTDFKGTLKWALADFSGHEINKGEVSVDVSGISSMRAVTLRYRDILKGHRKQDAVLLVTLMQDDLLIDEKYWLLVPDKNANLPKVSSKIECTQLDQAAQVTIFSPVYARYVYLEAEGITAPWSDNFFDIPAGKSVTVTVNLPDKMNITEFKSKLKIKTLTDVEAKNGKLMDKLIRLQMVFKKKNFITWLIFKFL